ncbi:MAG: sigma factor-like helix-turn-helix DNA-binding protein [Candidatus Binatia bacterium]
MCRLLAFNHETPHASGAMCHEFEGQLVALFPKMRTWALALTRSKAAADDLTQDVALKILAARTSFIPGINSNAWVHRIMINHFLSEVRCRREFADAEMMPAVAVNDAHEHRTALWELSLALDRLPAEQRDALSRIVLNEQSYEGVSAETGDAVGTSKSRVHRARVQLRCYIGGNAA